MGSTSTYSSSSTTAQPGMLAAYAQAGPSTMAASNNLSNQSTMSPGKYTWCGSRSSHGFAYEKDLSYALFVAAALEERSFRLATEMREAGKFNDAVLILDDRKEIWLFQAKHSQSAKGTVKFNEFFPTSVDENSEFSLPKFIQSYFNILQDGEFKDYKKRIIIFTNKSIDKNARQDLQEYMEIKDYTSDRPLENDEIMKNCEKFNPKNEKINDLLNKINFLPIAVLNAIKEFIKSGKILSILLKYTTPLQNILNIGEEPLRFSNSFTTNKDNVNLNWLSNELRKTFTWDDDGKIGLLSEKPLNRKEGNFTKRQLTNKSDELNFPRCIGKSDLKEFFECLVICSNQPDEFISVRDKSIETFITKWIHRKERAMFNERSKFHDIFKKEFEYWHSVTNMDGNQKPYLSSLNGTKCVDNIKAEMRNRLQKFSEIDFYNYVKRTVNFNGSSYDEVGIKKLLESDPKRFLMLVGEPGMGKTTFMQKIAFLLQTDIQKHVYFICMNALFKNQTDKIKHDFQTMVKSALSDSSFHFMQNSLKYHPNKCYILMDGFDEMETTHQSTAIKIIKEKMCESKIPVFISGRNNVREILENAFKVDAMNLISLVEDEQMQFLKKYWDIDDTNQNELMKFSEFSRQMLTKLHNNIRSKHFRFTGLPLIIRMLAEVTKGAFEIYAQSADGNIDEYMGIGNNFSLLELYKKFINISFYISIKKSQNDEAYSSINQKISDDLSPSRERFDLKHQLAAIEQLNIHELRTLTKDEHSVELGEYMKRIQDNEEKSLLINISSVNEINFVHLSYAEYFIAKYLFDNMMKCKDFLIKVLENREVVQTFFFSMLEENFDNKSLQMTTIEEICDHDPYTMYLACQGGHEKIVRELLRDRSAKLMFKGRYRSGTLLHAAARSENDNLISFLCEHHFHGLDRNEESRCESSEETKSKITINTQDDDGRTPISMAAMFGNTEGFKVLFKNEANVHIPDNMERTPLHMAVKFGDWEIVKPLIENNSAAINTQDNDGQTPLHFAIRKDNLKSVKMFIEVSLDAMKTQDEDGQTPQHLNFGKILIDKYLAAINTQDEDGQTPQQLELIKMLIDENSAAINTQDNDGNTPLHFAIEEKNLGLVKMLIDKNSDAINTQAKFYGHTPLHCAILKHNLELVEMLIDKNSAAINTQDKKGSTPLHWAIHFRKFGIEKVLIEHNATDINIQNNDGQTPLHLAAKGGNLEAVELLLMNNSLNINIQDNDGNTPLRLATERGYLRIVDMLSINPSD